MATTTVARTVARREIARRIAAQQLRIERAEKCNLLAVFVCMVMRASMITWSYLFSHQDASASCSRSIVEVPKRPPPPRRFKSPTACISGMVERMRKQMLESEPSSRGHWIEQLARLWERNGIYPRNSNLTSYEVSVDPGNDVGRGGYGMCVGGTFLGRFPVALKFLWDVEGDKSNDGALVDHGQRRLNREIQVWEVFNHPRILRFIGLYTEGDKTYMVSPYMQNGNACEYTRNHPGVNFLRVLLQVAEGLEYLHGLNAVHGDICGNNILVSASGDAYIADFGLSLVEGKSHPEDYSSSWHNGGNARWKAPELMAESDPCRSTMSDMFSFGRLILELTTGQKPFPEIKNEFIVMLKVWRGDHPQRPRGDDVIARGLNDEVWKLAQDCWQKNPRSRPTATEAVQRLKTALARCENRIHNSHTQTAWIVRSRWIRWGAPLLMIVAIDTLCRRL
ncbi:hypothetical protein BOTBODRAFT_186127 [Botryobasidium botryosum FD-172 SS1]|uniref:Protein kinase domain-containing protein n=1 Tax=Botryobasidium botryosum (strain FD-172 SS1) TaxID=930990 RepID=A0A067MYG8_BOTB1|nr:hypothetical protein BOTBODRAFT_186127 [Botryobasidium botryosum FD-172 SS1]